jgi:hypothetical protein
MIKFNHPQRVFWLITALLLGCFAHVFWQLHYFYWETKRLYEARRSDVGNIIKEVALRSH